MNDKDFLKFGKKLGLLKTVKFDNINEQNIRVNDVKDKIFKIKRNLDEIFMFLKDNTAYNRQTQHAYYSAYLSPQGGNYARISALLYAILQTQSRPSLDDSTETWQILFNHRTTFDAVQNPTDLLDALSNLSSADPVPGPTGGIFDRMWYVLAGSKGFGEKTAALFIKSIIDVHTLEVNTNLRFLDNVYVASDDFVRVPVDSVIKYIFKHITGSNLDFDTINDLIFKVAGRTNDEATIWDDLWFWGFITQHGGGDDRKLAINEAKFWAIYGTPKEKWADVRAQAEKFIEVLRACGFN
ncbi:hypothetical protein [Acidiphilium sp. C61]|uniref:hypothetical protein n=1 Tax=Acidiphilium sp. C61 TaxID=1671485 RepID=UPI00157B9272|nr:hypothetical protein [Acidiphilium sp. C61]